jgi:hypothetical protein
MSEVRVLENLKKEVFLKDLEINSTEILKKGPLACFWERGNDLPESIRD